MFISDAVETLAVTTPAVGTTGGRVVMQTNWAGTGGAGAEARTRLVAKLNSDGNSAPPALVQSAGTTWEISLATFTITTGGVITVTDARTFRKSTMVAGSGELSNDSVSNAILRNSAAVSVIGRSANSSGDPADIAAGANDTLLRRVSDALSWGLLTLGMIPDALITFAKLGPGAALSVLGRASNSSGVMADITAGTDGHVLRRSGTTLGFGTLASAAYGALSVLTAAIADLAVTTGKLADQAVTFIKMQQAGALSVWGRATNTAGTVEEIQAGTDAHVLRRLGTTLGFGTVATDGLTDGAVTLAKMAADSVDDSKAGNRVPAFIRRQGGDASNWDTPGTTNYTPGAVRQQGGAARWTGAATINSSLAVTFPVAFSNQPIVLVTSKTFTIIASISAVTATGFVIDWYSPTSSQTTVDFNWFAVGRE